MIKNKKTLWSIFSRKIREGSADHQGYVICPSCGKTFLWSECDCGHFIENSERKKDYGGNELWYDKRNFTPQCRSCNYFGSAEAKQKWTVNFIEENGIKLYRKLLYLKNTPKKWTPEEVNELIDNL